MTNETLRRDIEALLKRQGIEAFGYCSALPFQDLAELYGQRKEKNLACDFEERKNIQALVDPNQLVANAGSFLVILVPHSPYESQLQPLQGRFASGTVSLDYHRVVWGKLQGVSELLTNEGIDHKILCDTSPLSDRAIAVRAGLGPVRRNGMFYHKSYGSYVHIGSILMTRALHEKDSAPIKDPCGHCRRCMAACPGQAILGDGTINSNLCVSWLTQKKTLAQDESSTIGRQIYGCDICQKVCPINKTVNNPKQALILDECIALEDLLHVSNKDFKASYQATSVGWRGKRTLQRNALAILGNEGKEVAMPLLEEFLLDPRPIISQEAERSIRKIKAQRHDHM